jgi:hypothetical protein
LTRQRGFPDRDAIGLVNADFESKKATRRCSNYPVIFTEFRNRRLGNSIEAIGAAPQPVTNTSPQAENA